MKIYRMMIAVGLTFLALASLPACNGDKVFDQVEVDEIAAVPSQVESADAVSKDEVADDTIINPTEVTPKTEEENKEESYPPLPPAVVDADGDGVIDPNDHCADTAKDVAVDDKGCPVYAFVPGFNYSNISHDYQPQVVASFPKQGANDVPLDSGMDLKLDVVPNKASIESKLQLKVYALIGWFDVAFDFIAIEGSEVIIHPKEKLKPGAIYAVIIEKGLVTEKGTSTEDIVLSFKTTPVPDISLPDLNIELPHPF